MDAETIDPTEATDLVVITGDAFTIFSTEREPDVEHPIDKILKPLRDAIDNFNADVETKEGRAAMRTFAARISSAKTRIEEKGKEVADEQKKIPKRIDATRRYVKETMDTWRDEVRAPLTAWEKAEEDRVENLRSQLGWLEQAGSEVRELTPDEFAERISEVQRVDTCEDAFAEYAEAAEELKERALSHLNEQHAKAVKREAEAAELAELRKQKEEREKLEAEADRKAEEERRAKEAADAAVAKEREAAAQRERDLIEAKERAEKAAAEAAANAKREAEEAAEKQRTEDAKRAADKEHRRKINRAAVAAIVANGLSEGNAQAVVSMIAAGKIPAVTINY
jgi:septal ring factor EnvC (AmiA/AmiB activator)